jgi:general secretion pathway protein C
MTSASAPWIVRGVTFALWALAAGSAAYWGLKWSAATPPVAAPVAPPRAVGPVDPGAVARFLGSTPAGVVAAPAAPALASRFQLLGVAAGVRSGEGAAVIAVDGKPPRSFRVGSVVDEGYVLHSVRGRQAVIATQRDGAPVATLELPKAQADLTRPPPMAVAPAAPAFVPAGPGVAPVTPGVPMPPSAPAAPSPIPPGGAQAPTAEPR